MHSAQEELGGLNLVGPLSLHDPHDKETPRPWMYGRVLCSWCTVLFTRAIHPGTERDATGRAPAVGRIVSPCASYFMLVRWVSIDHVEPRILPLLWSDEVCVKMDDSFTVFFLSAVPAFFTCLFTPFPFLAFAPVPSHSLSSYSRHLVLLFAVFLLLQICGRKM